MDSALFRLYFVLKSGTDLSNGVNIIKGSNDEFIFDEDGVPRTLKFTEGNYGTSAFISEINLQLEAMGSEVKASLFDGKLKLAFDSVGYRTIDNVRGNARELMFKLEGRDSFIGEYYQVGANGGQHLQIDNALMSTGKLRMNTLYLETRKSCTKSLVRLDGAIGKLSAERSKIGAISNRLEHIIKINDLTAENLQSAETKISDINMAKAMIELSRENILGDVFMSIKSQMIRGSEGVLQLLK